MSCIQQDPELHEEKEIKESPARSRILNFMKT
jgi:hypothetical protein